MADTDMSVADMVNMLRDKTIMIRFNPLEVEIFLVRLGELGYEITPMAAKEEPAPGVWLTTAPGSAPVGEAQPSPEITGGKPSDNEALVAPAEVAVHPEMAHDFAPAAEGKLEAVPAEHVNQSTEVVDPSAKVESDTPVAEPAPIAQKPQDQTEEAKAPEPAPEPAAEADHAPEPEPVHG